MTNSLLLATFLFSTSACAIPGLTAGGTFTSSAQPQLVAAPQHTAAPPPATAAPAPAQSPAPEPTPPSHPLDAPVDDALDRARQQYAQQDAERTARYDAALAKYKAAGIDGDKLAYVDRSIRNGDAIFGVGGVELTTPAEVKQASVMFELEGGDDREWTLYRAIFRGDQRIATTAEGFLVRPGPSKFR